MPSLEQVERTKTLRATGSTVPQIAKKMGVTVRTIHRWLLREDPPEIAEELERIRSENREKFVNESWANIHGLNDLLKKRIAEGPSAFKNPKEIAVCLGVSVDKVAVLERPEAKGGSGSGVTIIINPPAQLDGDTTRIIADSVPVSDIEGEICGDDRGGGSGKDLLALPPGRDDSPGEPGEPRDDSS